MTRPRGRLPARVYWTRRLLVVVVVAAVVFGVAQLVGGQGAGRTASARSAATEQASSSPSSGSTTATRAVPGGLTKAQPDRVSTGAHTGGKRGSATGIAESRAVLPAPTGPCAPRDVKVSPGVRGTAYAGSDVTFVLELTTRRSPACTWEVSPASVVLKLTSGSDRIWSTQDCPTSIETRSVVVRRTHPAKAFVTWNGQRSDAECSPTTPWAQAGYYYAEAAALGGDPGSAQFHLLTPAAPTITASPTPEPSASASASASAAAGAKPSSSSGSQPSGAGTSASVAPRHDAKKADHRR